MRIRKYIDVRNRLISFEFEALATEVENVPLSDPRIIMVCEGENGLLWVERDPFNGREEDFDRSEVDAIFSSAWTKAQAEANARQEVLDHQRFVVRPLQLMAAIDESRLVPQFQAWENDPARTFMEKSRLRYSSHFIWDEEILKSMFSGMGLSTSQSRDLFELARTLNV